MRFNEENEKKRHWTHYFWVLPEDWKSCFAQVSGMENGGEKAETKTALASMLASIAQSVKLEERMKKNKRKSD